jgi:hypothetical protein
MKEQRRPIPEPSELFVALGEVIDLQLNPSAEADKVAGAAAVLTLECVGGPGMPATPTERDERLRKVRELLGNQVSQFAALPDSELASLSVPRGDPAGGERFTREAERLEDAATTMFQLNRKIPGVRSKDDLWAAANAIWGRPPPPDSRWYERSRHKFVLKKLSEWLVESEQACRESHPLKANELSQREQTAQGDNGAKHADAGLGESPRPGVARRYWLLTGGAVLASSIVIWQASGLFSSSDGEPLPIEQQIAADIPKDGTVRMLREVRLHDAANPSYFVVVRRPPPRKSPRRDQLEPWDELRVYDRDGSDAELQFIGQPVALVGGAPTVKHAGLLWGTRTGRMYQFTLLGIHDTNGDGRAEIYGTLRDQISSVTRPFAVEWNDDAQQYEMVPLVPDPPQAPVYGDGYPGGVASYARRESRTALRMYVAPDERHVRLYGATQVSIREVQGLGWVLISGYGAVSGRKDVSRDLESRDRQVGRGFKSEWMFSFGNMAAVTRLTVEVARLRDTDGIVEPEPCEIYATTRLRLEQPSGPGTPGHPPPPPKYTLRIVPKLMTNALAKEPLDPQQLDLHRHVAC